MSIGYTEIILILLVVLLLFGAKRIPELARSLGKASYEFKKAKDSIAREGEELADTAEKRAAAEDKTSVRNAEEHSSDSESKSA